MGTPGSHRQPDTRSANELRLIESDRQVSLLALVAAAVMLDMGAIADQTLGRRAINMILPEARGAR